jgi:hypothetical protein|tara:strand:- start:1551 stop:1688 length:138 start_codon:yes stop_codon:yes gene_type:complete
LTPEAGLPKLKRMSCQSEQKLLDTPTIGRELTLHTLLLLLRRLAL